MAGEVSSEIPESTQEHVRVCRSLLIWIWERAQLRPCEKRWQEGFPVDIVSGAAIPLCAGHRSADVRSELASDQFL